jgi:hypothetical protein
VLYGELNGKHRKRDVYAVSKLDEMYKAFPFGTFLVSEDFQIKLRSLFLDTEDRQAIFPLISKLTVTDEIGAIDDGVTQTVSVKRGMSGALTEQAAPKPIVSLKPFRTFREIDQPESEFLFRMKAIEGKVPTLALFEADGGAWALEAVSLIAHFFNERLKDVKVVV